MKRLRASIVHRRDDPIPAVLTVGGLALSIASAGAGIWMDAGSLFLNLAAALTLVGPALLISNLIVGKVQRARSKHKTQPLIDSCCRTIAVGTEAPQRATELLYGKPVPEFPDPVQGPEEVSLKWLIVEITKARILTSNIFSGRETAGYSMKLDGPPLNFVQFGALLKTLEIIHADIPIPYALAIAVRAEDWSNSVVLDTISHREDPGEYEGYNPGMISSHIGLVASSEGTREVGNSGSFRSVDLDSLRNCLNGQLYYCESILDALQKEIPDNQHKITLKQDLDQVMAVPEFGFTTESDKAPGQQ